MAAQSTQIHVQTDRNYRHMTASKPSERQTRNQMFREIAAHPERTRAYLLRASMLGHRAADES